jgi:hypothetical protein
MVLWGIPFLLKLPHYLLLFDLVPFPQEAAAYIQEVRFFAGKRIHSIVKCRMHCLGHLLFLWYMEEGMMLPFVQGLAQLGHITDLPRLDSVTV